MNSSISSSDPEATAPPSRRRGAAWKIVVFVAAVFMLLEIVTRGVLLPRSKDFVRFADYPARAERLVRQPGMRLAFIGNSATQRGLDTGLLAEELPKTARQPVPFDLFLADASSIDTWYYMVKRCFWKEDRRPDWLIVHFFGDSLADGNQFEIGRIALFFSDKVDWQDLVALDLPTATDRVDYLLSTRWTTFAARDRIRSRALAEIVPDYREFAAQLNAGQVREQKQTGATSERRSEEQPPKAYRALDRFLTQATAHKTRTCFVAFPMRPPKGQDPYPLDPRALERIRESGMDLLDLRRVPELGDKHYEDNVHLTPAGAKIYTKEFMKAVATLLAPSQRP